MGKIPVRSFKKSQSDGGEAASALGGLLLRGECDVTVLEVEALTPHRAPGTGRAVKGSCWNDSTGC